VAGGAGAAALAAHTVVRQLFEFWGLIFTAFNIATQSLVASALAKVSCTSETVKLTSAQSVVRWTPVVLHPLRSLGQSAACHARMDIS
jgi:hypothetical protein